MSRSHPSSSPRHPETEQDPRIMTETQRVLPPPTFLGRPEQGYTSFRPQLPSLQPYPDAHSATSYAQPPYRDMRPLPPIRTGYREDPPTSRPTGQAVPISSLLSDPTDKPAPRSDSLLQSQAHSTISQYRPVQQASRPEQAMIYHAYSPPSPQYQIHAPVATHPATHSRPIFGSPFSTSTYPAHSHHRRVSSTCSPTSDSAHSQPGYPYEPHSAVSEVSVASFAYQQPPEPETPELEYSLRMRQQPIAARACGFGERDRRVVDPPPIIELVARDPMTGEQHYESDSYTTLHCVLIDAETGEDQSQIPAHRPDVASAQRLMGNAVASPCVANDEKGQRGSFFVFPDLSCRSPGKYKLMFRLLKINPRDMVNSAKNRIRAKIESEAFEVFTAKEFPGMRASSQLLRSLRMQGLNVGVKKGSEASKRNARKKAQSQQQRKSGDEDDDNDDDDDEEGSEHGSASEDEEVPSKSRGNRQEHAGGSNAKGKSRVKRIKSQ